MNSLIQTLRYNWHPMRVVYLVMATAILAQAWEVKDWPWAYSEDCFCIRASSTQAAVAQRSILLTQEKPLPTSARSGILITQK